MHSGVGESGLQRPAAAQPLQPAGATAAVGMEQVASALISLPCTSAGVIDLVGAPAALTVAGPPSKALDLCSNSDAEAARCPAVGDAAAHWGSVIDLCSSNSELGPEQQQAQPSPQQPLHQPPEEEEQEQQQGVLVRGHCAAPRTKPTKPEAMKQEPGVVASAMKHKQPTAQRGDGLAAAAAALMLQAPPPALATTSSLGAAEAVGDSGGSTSLASKKAGSLLEAASEEPTSGSSGLEPEALAHESSQRGVQHEQEQRQPMAAESVGDKQAMEWEASSAADAAPASAKDLVVSPDASHEAAAAVQDISHSGTVGARAVLTEPATGGVLDSLLATVEVEGPSACWERSSGSPLAASEPAGIAEGADGTTCQVRTAGAAGPKQQQAKEHTSAAKAVVGGEGELSTGAAVAGTVDSLVAACQAQSAGSQQHQLQHGLPPSKLRLATSPALRRLAQTVKSAARQDQALLTHTAATATAAATAAGTSATVSAAGGEAATTVASYAAEDHIPPNMPDESDAGAMLHWLRSKIPAKLLEQYKDPHGVADKEYVLTLQRLEMYEQEIKRVERQGQKVSKFDLVAASQLPSIYPQWALWEKNYGHKPGVRLGQQFKGRGWLMALGVHTQYYNGIMHEKEEPAYAICLSGGYEDDDDHGDWLWYTGMGGRSGVNGTQGADQKWTRGNAAIRACWLECKPLRVIRGVHMEQQEWDAKKKQMKVVKKLCYTYDGLYYVVHATRKLGLGGKSKVCKFLMVGIPGHYKANKSVSFMELRGFRDRMRLAGGEDEDEEDEEDEEEGKGENWAYMAGRHKRQKMQAAAGADQAQATAIAATSAAPKAREKKVQRIEELHPALVTVKQDAAWLVAQQRRPGFLCADITGGVEKYQIPVFNVVDDEPPPHGLTYIRSSVVGSPEAQKLLNDACSVMPSEWCGLEWGYSKGIYLRDGLMKFTRCEGHWECAPNCQRRKCTYNRVVSELGMSQPLEIFRTLGKGWGVRCDRDIPAGAFICSYKGNILTHEEAEARRGTDGDAYFFDLDHFVLMYEDKTVKAQQRLALPPLPFHVAPEPATNDNVETLVIDAATTGNIARFINHSCDPNLYVQPVLRPGDSGLRYCVGIFAHRDIPKGTELSYDYKYTVASAQKIITCHCGAEHCKGRLI